LRIRSFRTRLILWNTLLLSASFMALGLALTYINGLRLERNIDRELLEQVSATGRRGPPPNQPFPLGPPVQPGRPMLDGPGGPPPPGGMGRPPGEDLYLDAAIAARIRRPLFFGRDGRSVGPFPDEPPFEASALAAAYRGERVLTTSQLEGRPIRVASGPWMRGGDMMGAVQIARDLSDLGALRSEQLRTLLFFLPIAVVLAAVGGLFMARRALRPVAALTAAATEISATDLERRLPAEGDDEIAKLALTFNAMLARLGLSFQEREQAFAELQRAYESQRRFAADASHELRTPLTRLQIATSSALGEAATEQDRDQALRTANEAAQAMSRLVGELLTLSRGDAGQLARRRERLDLRLIVSEALEQSSVVAATEFADAAVTVESDPDQLRRVALNLLENAERHGGGAPIFVSVRAEGGEALLEVADQGPGIPPEHLPHVFERFYRADTARTSDGGVGLGLAICKSIVEAHGGRIEIHSKAGSGVVARVWMPLA
jgi:two-component system, OmpR family, sensor kinase